MAASIPPNVKSGSSYLKACPSAQSRHVGWWLCPSGRDPEEGAPCGNRPLPRPSSPRPREKRETSKTASEEGEACVPSGREGLPCFLQRSLEESLREIVATGPHGLEAGTYR